MTENRALVSIAMATYNGECYLRKQLDSIYAQTYKNIEVIVCDDCSSDSTVAMLEEYKKTQGLQYFVNVNNRGYLKNFERVLGLCRGGYIALADQDDIWMPNKIERLIGAISGYTMVYSDASYIDQKDNIIAKSVRKYASHPVVSGKPFKILAFHSFIIGCTLMLKRELLLTALPFPEGEKFHDRWLSLIACKLDGVVFLDEQLVLYRKHAGNTIGLSKASHLFDKLFGFLLKPIDRKTFQIQEKRLLYLSKHKIFNDEEKWFLQTAHDYYYDRLQKGLHVCAFKIAFENRDVVFPNVKGFLRIKSVIGALLR